MIYQFESISYLSNFEVSVVIIGITNEQNILNNYYSTIKQQLFPQKIPIVPI